MTKIYGTDYHIYLYTIVPFSDYHNYILLHNCAIFIDILLSINKFYNVIIFSLLNNAVLLLNCFNTSS